ncbi:MAG: TrkH family potassium uptake protein [Planctomycetes bacterium]|nr:TrkH family potassium uptake protein [Planctomycetota bacterium]
MLVPLMTALISPIGGGDAMAFLAPALGLISGGYLMRRRLDPEDIVLTLQEGGVIVLLSWIVACAAGAVPFLVIEKLGFTQAFFESVSGWTTTGLSVLDVARSAPAILLWRSTMQLAGGAGLAIIMLAAIAGAGGASLSAAEGRSDHLVPNVRASALLVMRIYAGCVVIGTLALRIAGMDWFDAVNHSFCAFSTGGFSTRAESIGYWDSPAIEAVTIVLMLVGGTSFLTVWCLLRGRLRAVLGNGEVRLVAVLVPIFALLVLLLTCGPLYASASKACRVAVFETVTALTTTGYSTVGYRDWNAFGILLLIVLMLIGAGTCSTGGAIKQHRVYLLFRSLMRELRRPFLPRTAVTDDSIWIGDERVAVTEGQSSMAGTFVFLYVATWLCGSAVLAAHGYGLQDSLFEYASALGTVGLSIGITGPETPALVLWTETAGMLLGRLEFFVIFASATRLLLDSRSMATVRSS